MVASLDFWPNLGLSRMEKASRQFGLVFGRSIFEFGRTVILFGCVWWLMLVLSGCLRVLVCGSR